MEDNTQQHAFVDENSGLLIQFIACSLLNRKIFGLLFGCVFSTIELALYISLFINKRMLRCQYLVLFILYVAGVYSHVSILCAVEKLGNWCLDPKLRNLTLLTTTSPKAGCICSI